jgi:hypothetical protein
MVLVVVYVLFATGASSSLEQAKVSRANTSKVQPNCFNRFFIVMQIEIKCDATVLT